VPFDLLLLTKAQHGHAGQLGAIVGHTDHRSTTPGDDDIEFAHNPQAGQRSVGDQRQAFAGEVIDHGQNAETSAIGEGIRQKVEAPALVGSLRDRQRSPGAKCPFAPAAPTNLQPLLAIETTKLLVVHDQPLAAHQHKQTTVAEPAPDRRQLTQAGAYDRIVSPLTAIAHRCAVCSQDLARPPLAHLE
jgi:hypothetical protein